MKSSKVSLILHEDGSAPRFYEFKKVFFQFIMLGLPGLALLSIMGILGLALYFKQIKVIAEKKEPTIIRNLRDQKNDLRKELKEVKEQRNILETKLASSPSVSEEQSAFTVLALFKSTPGRQDLTVSPELSIEEEVQLISTATQLDLNFKIVNLTKDSRKVSGYIFVLMQTGNHVEVWPSNTFQDKEMQLSYNKGELFSTSRFRPVKASFQLPKKNEALFQILIFSRSGDLMFKKRLSKVIRN